MDKDIKYLLELEEKLLSPFTRLDTDELEAIIAPDFVEIGASGMVYQRDEIFAVLQAEIPTKIHSKDFKTTRLSPDIVLITYKTSKSETFIPGAIRSSIWSRKSGNWQMIFHQGTVFSGN